MLTTKEIEALQEAESKAIQEGFSPLPRHDFLIPEGRLEVFKKKCNRIVNKAAKLGLVLSYEIGGYTDQIKKFSYKDSSEVIERLVRYYAVHVEGEAPKHEGWVFAATVQPLDGGENIIRSILKDVVLPIEYRTSAMKCDHCRLVRRRNDCYVIYHSETKVWKFVGKNCLQDFLGNVDAEILARKAEFLSSILSTGEESEDDGFGGSGGTVRWPICNVLEHTAAIIAVDGWLSRSKANEMNMYGGGHQATADIVLNYLNPDTAKKMKKLDITEACKARAAASLEWAQEISEEDIVRSDYLYNIRTISRAGVVDGKTIGYVCSIVAAHQRVLDRQLERVKAAELGKASTYQGAVGEKLENLTVDVVKVVEIQGDYGLTSLVIMVDPNGNQYKWFASGCGPVDEKGEAVFSGGAHLCIKGTVKAHAVYQNVQATQLTRCGLYVPKAPKKSKAKKVAE